MRKLTRERFTDRCCEDLSHSVKVSLNLRWSRSGRTMLTFGPVQAWSRTGYREGTSVTVHTAPPASSLPVGMRQTSVCCSLDSNFLGGCMFTTRDPSVLCFRALPVRVVLQRRVHHTLLWRKHFISAVLLNV